MKGLDPIGNDVVAIYPMLENNLCQLLVFDFDNHAKGAEQDDYANVDDSWKDEINALRRICKNLKYIACRHSIWKDCSMLRHDCKKRCKYAEPCRQGRLDEPMA